MSAARMESTGASAALLMLDTSCSTLHAGTLPGHATPDASGAPCSPVGVMHTHHVEAMTWDLRTPSQWARCAAMLPLMGSVTDPLEPDTKA